MMYRASIALLLLAVCIFYAPTVCAQVTPGVLQSAAQTATITGSVTQSNGRPVIGASVQLNGPGAHLTTQSDEHGMFVFTSVPYGTYTLAATGANLGTATRNLVLKGDISVTIQYVAQNGTGNLKEIAHVSTQSAGVNINVTPANIASVNPSDYAFQGNTSWKELLGEIPGVTVGGNLYGGKGTANAIPDGPFQPIVVSINGTLPYETSVTLDGMPLQNESFASSNSAGGGVDLYSLPMTTFDTADIVRGPGANAPSIVDSVGGSFVLHAPGRIDKDQSEFSVSSDPYGGIVSNAKIAARFGRLSAVLVYGVNDSPGPLGSQNVIPVLSYAPYMLNGQPFLGCSSTGASCYGGISNPQYANGNYTYQDSLLYCCIPFDTAWTQHNGALALSYDITPSITAQVFYAGSSSYMQFLGSEFPVNFMPGAGYSGSIAPGPQKYINASTATLAQASSLLEEKVTVYMGLGVLRLAALQNNSFNQEGFPNLLPDGQYTLYGIAYLGTTSPGTQMVFNGTPATLTFTPAPYNEDFWVNNRDILASYTAQLGSKSSAGISYVTSYYNSPFWYSGFCGVPFNFSFSGSQPSAVSERTNEVRLYASTALSDKLSVNASWYFTIGTYHVQNPADFTGNTYKDSIFHYDAPRLGAVWRVNRDVAIRAAAGGGYALPQLSYLVGTNYPPFCTTYCSVTLNNLNLQPEKSFGWDLGTDIRFHHDTVLTFDLYRADIFGQFFQSTNLTGTYHGLPLYTTQYNNLSQSRFEGVNFDLHHDVQKGMYWNAALGLTRGYVVSVPSGFYNSAGPSGTPKNTYIVPGINFDGAFQSTVPYANGTAQIGYRWPSGKYIDLSPTYYGKNNVYFETAFVEFDAHAGYALTKNISLLATFRNITGIYDQTLQFITPSMAAPTVTGLPYALFGIPYGPRSAIVTLNLKY